jgi:hypothetical protein
MTRFTDKQRSVVRNVATFGCSVEILREIPRFLSGEQQLPYDACQPFEKLPGLRIITFEARGDSEEPENNEPLNQDNLRKCLRQLGAHEGVELRVGWHNFGSRKAYRRITFTRKAAHWVWESLLGVLEILSYVFYAALGLVFLVATLMGNRVGHEKVGLSLRGTVGMRTKAQKQDVRHLYSCSKYRV